MSRYSKSDRDIFMEVLKPSMGAGAYIKDFRKSDAPQFKGKTEKERDKMAVAAYLDAKDEMSETKLPPHLAKLFDKDGNFKDKKKQAMFDKMQKAARKGIKFTSKDVTPKGYGPEEGIEESKKPSMQSLFALIADTKNAQEGIAKIMKALNVNEKKASVMMDKLIAYALKKEELELGETWVCGKCNAEPCTCEMKEDYVITLKGKEVSRHKKENDARSAWHKLRKQHGNDVKVTKEGVELDERAPKMKYALVGKDMKIYSMGSDERDLKMDRRSLEQRFKDAAPLKIARLKTAQTIGDKVDKSQLKEETIEEGAMLNLATVKFQAKDALGKIRHKVTQKGNKYIISVDSNDEKDAQKAMKDHPLYAAGKLRVMPESFFKKITGVDSLKENRARRDAMRAMGRRRGKDPADIDTDASDDDVKAASKNIIMQLRKSVTMKGNYDVEFEKEKKKVPANIAQFALDKHARLRTSMDKGEFDKKIRKSYRDLLNALKEK